MKLNIAIIADYLRNSEVISTCIQEPFVFHLNAPVFYTGGTFFQEYLYIVDAEALPEKPDFENRVSILSRGVVSEEYNNPYCEYVCVSAESEMAILFNDVTWIFHSFFEWEILILNHFRRHASFHEVGEVLFQILQNPISFCTPILKIEMHVIDDEYPLPPNYGIRENEYLSVDEHELVLVDEEYKETLKTKYPSIFSNAIYGFRKLYYNIFHENEYIGRIVIDEIYHPAKESDLSILILFSEYVKMAYLENCSASMGLPRELDTMFKKLLIYNNEYLERYDKILEKYGWKKNDYYLCAHLVSTNEEHFYSKIIEDTIYLHRLFENNYAFSYEKAVILIINLGNKDDVEYIYKQLNYFSNKFNYSIGLSNAFNQFHKIHIYYRQAVEAYVMGQKKHPQNKVFKFHNYIVDIIIQNTLDANDSEFYISRKFACLENYDKEKGTELVKTLKVALSSNMSASVAQEILHVHRTTYLYRMRRIEEISGLNLEEYEVRLYLMILLKILDK